MDNDLRFRLIVKPQQANTIKAQVAKDANWLQSMNIMDYSLLVGVRRKRYPLQTVTPVIQFCYEEDQEDDEELKNSRTVSKALSSYVEQRRRRTEAGRTDMVVTPAPNHHQSDTTPSATGSLKGASPRGVNVVGGGGGDKGSSAPEVDGGLVDGDQMGASAGESLTSPSAAGGSISSAGGVADSAHSYANQDGLSAYVIEGPSTFYLGIIDIFQSWDLGKKVEHCAKRTFQCTGTGISAVDPQCYRERFVKFCCEKVIESLDGHVEVQSQATDSQMLLDTKGHAFPTKLHNFTSILHERFDNISSSSMQLAPSLPSGDSHSVLLDTSRAPIRPARKEKEKRSGAQDDVFSMTLSPAVFTLLVKNADFRDAKIIITKDGEATIESTRAHLEQLTKTAKLFETGATNETLFDDDGRSPRNKKAIGTASSNVALDFGFDSNSPLTPRSRSASPRRRFGKGSGGDGGGGFGAEVVEGSKHDMADPQANRYSDLKTIQLRKLMFENGLLDPEDEGAVQSMTRQQMINAIEVFHQRGIPALDASSGALQI